MNELVSCRMKQQSGHDCGDWLIEKSRQDPVVVHEVTSRLQEVTKPVDDLSRKLSFFKSELESHLMQQKNFAEIVPDFEVKLRKMEDIAWKLRPISAIYSKARGQYEEFKPTFREVQNVKKIYGNVLEQKEKVGEDLDTVSPEVAAAAKTLPELGHRWESILDTVMKYHSQITAALPQEEVFHYAVMKFAPWLEDTEKKAKELEMRPISRPEEIEEVNIDVKVGLGVSSLVVFRNSTYVYKHIRKHEQKTIEKYPERL